MALHRARPSDIPSDAVRLTKEEAVDYQLKILHDWKDGKDTRFMKYGSSILGGASAAVGIYLNNYYRNKLKLRNFGLASSFLAIAIIPAGLTTIFHYKIVVPSIVLKDTCAVCTEMRAAALQAIFGCAVPSILASMSGFSTALNYGTYNVPYLTEPMKVIQLWRKLTKPIGNILFGLFLAQALLASGITILESRDVDTVNDRLVKMYKEFENS